MIRRRDFIFGSVAVCYNLDLSEAKALGLAIAESSCATAR
jgi:hypothetical protein